MRADGALETVWENEGCVLLRGRESGTGLPILIKTSAFPQQALVCGERLQHEYDLRDRLDASGWCGPWNCVPSMDARRWCLRIPVGGRWNRCCARLCH